MKYFAITFGLLLWLKTAVSQTRQKCTSIGLRGECVAFKDCSFSERFAGIAHKEDLQELQNRISACKAHGNLVCCEKNEQTATPAVLMTRPTPTTRITTKRSTRTPTASPTKAPTFALATTMKTPGDPLLHPNYQQFRDIKCGTISINRVSMGNNTALYEFPWAAQLGYQKFNDISFNCGGTLISEYYVLTAAHCLDPKLKLMIVRLGEWDAGTDLDCDPNSDPEDPDCAEPVQDISVKSYLAHPDFERQTVFNDIGIIQLAEGAKIGNRNIKPICLPFSPELHTLPRTLVVIGWGRTESSPRSSILQKAAVPLFGQADCIKKFTGKRKFSLIDGQFCAGGEGKIDACKGDSGSSIQSIGTVDGKAKMVQFGIVSYGVQQCGVLEGYPGIYTKTSVYLNWILDNMQ